MSKVNIMPADTYIVVNRTVLSDYDRKLLIMLYQPIVGMSAINFYFTLWSYLDKSEILSCVWTHHHLLGSMGITISELLSAREKLEGIGLLKTYIKEDEVRNFVYEIYSPLTAHDFFNNPILSTVLYTNVGSVEFDKIKEYFKVPKMNLSGYEDITSSFSDIYESTDNVISNNDEIKKRTTQTLSLLSTLDLESIFSLIPEEMIAYKNITRDMKDFLIKLSFVYHLNEEEMGRVIRDSINEKHRLDKDLLRMNCRNLYQFEHGGKLPSIIYRNQPEYLRKQSTDTSLKSQVIYQFETMSPYTFLCSKSKDGYVSKSESSILEYLLIDLNLTPGVVNVLIDYILKVNNNQLSRSFVEVVAGQWKRSNLETVEGAMQFAEKEYKKRKGTSKKVIKVESKPAWFDQDVSTNSEIDVEKQKELEDILKEFR